MKCFSNKIVFVCFSLVLTLTLCNHENSATTTCRLWSARRIIATFTVTGGADKIKDSCPRNSTEKKTIEIRGTIKTLYEDSVKNITNLFKIDLVKVGLEKIQPGTFKDLSPLMDLIIQENKLKTLKTGTFVNLNVSFLSLRRNFISVLQPGVFQNLSLYQLALEENRLTKIAKGVFQDVSLTRLSLDQNGISRLEPGVFASLHPKNEEGISLSLSDNKIERLDPQVFDNKDIDHVNLGNNSISILHPGDLNNLPNLTRLNLTRNRLKEVPEGVFNASKIVILDLSHNQISVIANGALDGMKGLWYIRIHHNQLKEWDSRWFRGLSMIKIFASNNYIETIPEGSFVEVQEYTAVDLAHNQIRNISDGAFAGLKRLRSLDLSYNKIRKWKIEFLEKVMIQENVDLRGNNISCSEIESGIQQLRNQGFIFDKC
ncbi:hypothetical protein Zmor_018942 [Zophobas morio]|uniref:Uncharacterized protein n=1 Tax=Zophobas morio TaxID=2755281 RepID=A0AA38I8D6_9CUCU|nr:hypothetical protein Zmor_018942 [Zophobas morio]